ncbi:hypothetical protein FK85_27735 [Halorubrum saccharovorum]|uniref:Lipoprotein n=1 Tax=Halorubrum saccharovorum TaxID=2248 RepID=A0A0F8CKW7_9EURY|nr:hypothetical protein [Halorubrum saccharovorum]KKF39547.1 hypothetical protein FK85_27735 [Halorubrum saccharovorum]
MSPTRRALLRSASLGALTMGGCLGTETRGDGADPAAETRSTTGSDDDPTVLKVRNPGGEAVVVDRSVGDDGSESDDDESDESDGDADPAPIGRELVTTADRATELTVTAGVPDEDRSRVRSFLDDTDYETESVFVARAGIRSCYRFRIRSVSWEPGDVEYEYCRELRPPDAACETDTRDAVGLLFRLPAALDSPLTRSGSSGRSPCERVGTDYDRIDANATVQGNETALGESSDGETADAGTAGAQTADEESGGDGS